MGKFFYATPVGGFPTANGAAFGSFTTKKSIDPLPVSVIPGGVLSLGDMVAMRACGEFSTTGTPTVNAGFWLGTRALSITTDIALSSTITTGSGAAAWPWEMEWEGMVTAVGTAGTLVGCGKLWLGSSLTVYNAAVPIPITQALRTVTIDTTIERAIGVSWTWSANSASNTVTCYSRRVAVWN